MPAASTPPPSKPSMPSSGAITTASGDLHIPSSTRADGSLRKEIKIRPGYRPPEDVEVYKNRTAEAWKTRGSGGVPGAEGWKTSDGVGAAAAGRNAKRREARKRAKAAGKEGEEEADGEFNKATEKLENWREFSNGKPKANGSIEAAIQTKQPEPEPQLDPEAEKEKQARNLKKKLRQARELREKKDKGENLLPEQFEKVIKIQELMRQLDSLGFDSEGVRKDKT